jgi:membrane protein
MGLGGLWRLTVDAFNAWLEDRAPSMGAAIAYYTVFSLAPMLIIVIAVAGIVYDEQAAEGAIIGQLAGLMGRQGAAAVETMIRSANQAGSGAIASAVGIATLAVAATTVFGELQSSLNVIWKAEPRPEAGWFTLIRVRLLSLALIVGIGFLLLVFLVVSAALTALGDYLDSLFPDLHVVMRVVNFAVSFAVITALFAMIYKVLPDKRIAWGDVWIAALVTSLLFNVGRFLISLYIGSSEVASTYGAAGALVIVLLWVYYSAQIFLFGAEFSKVYALKHGSHTRGRWRRGEKGASRPAQPEPARGE